ncbi:MAG: lipoprotein-releasing ABC transporter ATP-binding protein LolD [Steroidobacteraceae bacterium]|jgi:lipoprotein-releasing system ATP-binding protein
MTEPSILACDGVHKHFEEAGQRLEVLRGVELQVRAGETLAIIGASGSGKTTLLQILGGLDLPTRGTVRLMGQAFAELSDAARGDLRNRALGFVYQFHHLLPEFSALENVAMPLLVRRTPAADARREAQWLLDRVGLGQRLTHRPSQLSGGERQRAAVARALVTRPQVVLADEPTGNLDGRNAEGVLELMLELNRELGTSLVLVTHSDEIASRMQRVLTLQDGQLVEG